MRERWLHQISACFWLAGCWLTDTPPGSTECYEGKMKIILLSYLFPILENIQNLSDRGGDMLLYLCSLSALSFLSVHRFLLCRRSNTRHSPDAGRNVGLYHRRLYNINPAIVYNVGQHLNGIGVVYTMCTHFRQNEIQTRAE